MVKTRVLIISDTHGVKPSPAIDETRIEEQLVTTRHALKSTAYHEPLPEADVVLHCGDLTKRSQPEEYERTFAMLRAARAPLKLAIAGNHDSVLDEQYYVENYRDNTTADAVKKIIADAEQDGVRYLTEGVYTFDLANGARLTLYASQYTPKYGGWGFQYDDGTHDFHIPPGVDIAMTHGPPHGVRDYAGLAATRAGCPTLFRAVHKARPKVHCYGHIHEAWGAFLASWKKGAGDEQNARRETAVDEDSSKYIKVLEELWPSPLQEDDETTARKIRELAELSKAGGAHVDLTEGDTKLVQGEQTLFVNAAIMDSRYRPNQLPWIVDLSLPKVKR